MATKAQKTNQKPPAVTIRVPEGVSDFYVNSLNVLLTPWDFILLFGSLSLPESISSGKQTLPGEIRVDAAIRMSPQHAKASASALQRMVNEYEKQFGEIATPADGGIAQ